MSGYYVPFQAAEREFTEKRSRFIGQIWRISDEDEARVRIEEVRRKHRDARHNCWCWRLRSGAERYSDDGEPQGTAGQPMLHVFQRRDVTDVCCVVTRYFGGVLLGAGGLSRAYGKAAKDALYAAGTALMCRWTLWDIPCPYALLDRMKREIAACSGRVEQADYGAEIRLRAAFPEGEAEKFQERLTRLSNGGLAMASAGEAVLPGEPVDPYTRAL